jgi:hypothetical protein
MNAKHFPCNSFNLCFHQYLVVDAWYAMQYDMPNGLAQSAYSAGGRSAAVDKGAVKVSHTAGREYKYTILASLGSTKTDSSGDNSSLYRNIPSTPPAEETDPIGVIDIGYHYNGAVTYTTDILQGLQASVTYYSGNPATQTSDTKTFSFKESNEFVLNEKTLVSGALNSNTLNDTTMILYPVWHNTSISANNNPTWLWGVAYHELYTPVVQAHFSC